MEGRVHNEFEALETPIGFIPKYDDLKKLFKQVFSKEFTQESYVKMFSIRIPQLLKRIDRIEAIFKDEEEVPEMFYTQLKEERQRLLEAKEQFGEEIISPFEFE
jgi:phosphoenolpyruvate carboxykinase (GTP)